MDTPSTQPIGFDPLNSNPPGRTLHILALPDFIQVQILSYLEIYDQVFGAIKTCKHWKNLLLNSRMLRNGRYPGYKFPIDDRILTTHALFNIAIGAYFKVKVEDGEIKRYFYDDAGRSTVDTRLSIPTYMAYEQPWPVGLDNDTYLQMPIQPWDISDCPFLDELALSYTPTGYEQRRREQLRGPEALETEDNKKSNDDDQYNSDSDSDYEESDNGSYTEESSNASNRSEESNEDARRKEAVEYEREERLQRIDGYQIQILANFTYSPGTWTFEFHNYAIIGKTIREVMEMAKNLVQRDVDEDPPHDEIAKIEDRNHYELEVRLLTWSDPLNHGCYRFLPSLCTRRNNYGDHCRLCLCKNK
ncbi:hypothetical protein TWF281_007003 [Arthrobotrys megalospora]